MNMTHWKASNLVAKWSQSTKASGYIGYEDEGDTFSLSFPGEAWNVIVSFTKVKHYPNLIRIRASNWKAEYEPFGVYDIDVARKFWKLLKENGFTVKEYHEAWKQAVAQNITILSLHDWVQLYYSDKNKVGK